MKKNSKHQKARSVGFEKMFSFVCKKINKTVAILATLLTIAVSLIALEKYNEYSKTRLEVRGVASWIEGFNFLADSSKVLWSSVLMIKNASGREVTLKDIDPIIKKRNIEGEYFKLHNSNRKLRSIQSFGPRENFLRYLLRDEEKYDSLSLKDKIDNYTLYDGVPPLVLANGETTWVRFSKVLEIQKDGNSVDLGKYYHPKLWLSGILNGINAFEGKKCLYWYRPIEIEFTFADGYPFRASAKHWVGSYGCYIRIPIDGKFALYQIDDHYRGGRGLYKSWNEHFNPRNREPKKK